MAAITNLTRLPDPRPGRNESVMATNNSSIVSKRSVERFYRSEPHFFRYFVKKPQRRSPLINRGYWLRMRAVDAAVQHFLNESSSKPKVILNLGSGYDPLAFSWLSKWPKDARRATFVDIDHPELMSKKVDVIIETPPLLDILQSQSLSVEKQAGALYSEHYLTIGCDLEDVRRLHELLADRIDLQEAAILFIAEVSLTYMKVAAADSVIRWAASFPDARFCMLEQCIPYGAGHPFAWKMIQHFQKLQTPLQAIHHYPKPADQEARFIAAGWSVAKAKSLWDLWHSDIATTERLALNGVEAFDEWEEFALFASHYFTLIATKTTTITTGVKEQVDELGFQQSPKAVTAPLQPPRGNRKGCLSRQPNSHRKFGAMWLISPFIVGHFGGLGLQTRLASSDAYHRDHRTTTNTPPAIDSRSLPDIGPRMCHTITALDHGRSLLVGGRTSPTHAFADCWLYTNLAWRQVEDSPIPIYRHCAAAVPLGQADQGVLVYGGKTTGGATVNDWYLWREPCGWVRVQVTGMEIQPRFGAVISCIDSAYGVLLGGLATDGTIIREKWSWILSDIQTAPVLNLTPDRALSDDSLSTVCRFGACIARDPAGSLLVGGVGSPSLPQDLDVVYIALRKSRSADDYSATLESVTIESSSDDQVLLLTGHSAVTCNDTILIVGGGAVCFSFGTHWNQGLLTLQWGKHRDQCITWTLSQSVVNQHHESRPQKTDAVSSTKLAKPNVQAITRVSVDTPKAFRQMMNRSTPFIIEGLDLGSCLTKWTVDYLKEKIGPTRPVVVHEASSRHMDFCKKNFRYVSKPFGAFMDQVADGSDQYLRSLASDKPAERPADFAFDFPELADDFRLPSSLGEVKEHAHSSPLRISGRVIMWLHYDVMANVLCQIRGSKRMLLYPPSDVSHLAISPGASSSSVNVFEADIIRDPSLIHTHPHEAYLQPGDVLYIPPLWPHTALPLDLLSVAVNVFFRNLEQGYAVGRDIYGNRDLQAYEDGRRGIDRIVKAFDGVPKQMRQFYLDRLTGELMDASRTARRGR